MYSQDKTVKGVVMPGAERLLRQPISSRPGPYGPRSSYDWRPNDKSFKPLDPDAPGKWSHDCFGQQIKGGNLAFLLGVDPSSQAGRSGGLTAEEKIAARNGGGGGGSRVGQLDLDSGRDLMSMDIESLGGQGQQQRGTAATGRGSLFGRVTGTTAPTRQEPRQQPRQQQQQQQLQPPRSKLAMDSIDPPPRPPPQVVSVSPPRQPKPKTAPKPPVALSIKGKSSRNTIDVRNLAVGTTVEDVVMTFASFGTILNSKSLPSPSDSVSVQLEFSTQDGAQTSISTFHDALADGRKLSVTFSPLPTPAPAPAPVRETPSAPRARPSTSSSAASAAGSGPRPLSQRREPSSLPAAGLLGRLGLPAGGGGPRGASSAAGAGQEKMMSVGNGEDLMDGLGSESKMYSDAIPLAHRSSSFTTTTPRGPSNGRHGGRGRGAASRPMRSARGVGMEVD